jgi:hypothetical protein
VYSLTVGGKEVDAVGVAEELLSLPVPEAEALAAKYIGLWGFKNTYAMGKHLAEKAVVGIQRDVGLPLVIVRPALVSGVAAEPYPGYSGNFAGQVGFPRAPPGARGFGGWRLEAPRAPSGAALRRSPERPACEPRLTAPLHPTPQVGGAVAYMVGLYNDQPEAVASNGNSVWDVVPGERPSARAAPRPVAAAAMAACCGRDGRCALGRRGAAAAGSAGPQTHPPRGPPAPLARAPARRRRRARGHRRRRRRRVPRGARADRRAAARLAGGRRRGGRAAAHGGPREQRQHVPLDHGQHVQRRRCAAWAGRGGGGAV